MGQIEQFKGIRAVPVPEYFSSGHRTCQGCESALVMRLLAKAVGARSIILGSTGCMYVANTSYYTTPWSIPWMHTQLGSAGSAALGAAAGLRVLMRKGKIRNEAINVIGVCGDGGGADMGLSAISATLTHTQYNCLILLYDNESYANTDIQVSGTSPWGVATKFSPTGKKQRIMHTRWKKNVAGMMAAGHPDCKYVATVCPSFPVDMMNKVRKALSLGGSTFVHALCPCPKGWGYDPSFSHQIGVLAVETGIWPLYEMKNGKTSFYGKSRDIAQGAKRRPVREYLEKQGRFAHLTDEDIVYFQRRVDEMWDQWLVPGIIPLHRELPRR